MRICAVRKKNGFAISAATGSEHDELTQKEGFASISFRSRGTRKEIEVFTSVRTLYDSKPAKLSKRRKDLIRLAVPEKPFGLTLFLRFFDRCTRLTIKSLLNQQKEGFACISFRLWETRKEIEVFTSVRTHMTQIPLNDQQ